MKYKHAPLTLALTLLLALAPHFAHSDDAPLDLQRAKAIDARKKAGETVSAEDEAYLKWAREEFQKRQQAANGKPADGKAAGANKDGAASTTPVSDPKIVATLVPLDELKDAYKGEDGGLYGGGRNTPPEPLAAAYREESKKIQPLNAEGKPSADGKIVLLSLGMSNTTMEFSEFVKTANADTKKAANVVVVDGAIGARTGLAWALDGAELLPAPEQERLQTNWEKMGRQGKGPGDTWSTAEKRLQDNGVTPQQVQVMWIKQAEARPASQGEFPAHARTLETDIIDILNIAKHRYPNLRIVYLSSRIFAGYATSNLNPEPYAYEEAFSMRWIIQEQGKGEPRLNYDPKHGAVQAPLVVWGPYLWANGKTPRKSDGLVWNEDDFVTTDHTHPSNSARAKVAGLLLNFYHTNEVASRWYLKPGETAAK